MHATITEDPTAWSDLRRRLLRQARSMVGDGARAEDLVQDTLIAMLGQSWRGEAQRSTWAIAILRHKVADWYRSPAARVEQACEVDDDAPASTEAPDRLVERQQTMCRLDACLDRLPQRARRVFMMREWLGYDVSEIESRLGLSAEHVHAVLYRARIALRHCMQGRCETGA